MVEKALPIEANEREAVGEEYTKERACRRLTEKKVVR
jgi:hypothetical protein